jgi:hypothetical protein
VRYKIQGDGSAIVLKEYLEYYHLGAVFPDILSYSKDDDLSPVA